MRSVRNLIET